MVDLRPFHGTTFNPTRFGDLSTLLAPPYDVIGPELQVNLYARGPYNVVRVELTAAEPGDPAGMAGDEARHRRAAASLTNWLRHGVLLTDPAPAVYLYEQRYQWRGGARVQRSFFALVRLAHWDEGAVLPHEQTLTGPKAERLSLLRATGAQISPIWALYEDQDAGIARLLAPSWDQDSMLAGRDLEGVEHTLRRVADPATLAALQRAFHSRVLYIADGHHRYETALAYAAERHRATPVISTQPYDFVLMMLSASSAPYLQVLPTFRLLQGLPDDRLFAMERGLPRYFHVETLARPAHGDELQALLDAALLRADGTPVGRRFVLADHAGDRWRLLMLRDDAAAPDVAPVLAGLDVWQLQHYLFEALLALDVASMARQEHVRYTRDGLEALAALRDGTAQLAAFLAPTQVSQLLAVADTHQVMPQKSTYFHPKPATGMVLHVF